MPSPTPQPVSEEAGWPDGSSGPETITYCLDCNAQWIGGPTDYCPGCNPTAEDRKENVAAVPVLPASTLQDALVALEAEAKLADGEAAVRETEAECAYSEGVAVGLRQAIDQLERIRKSRGDG